MNADQDPDGGVFGMATMHAYRDWCAAAHALGL